MVQVYNRLVFHRRVRFAASLFYIILHVHSAAQGRKPLRNLNRLHSTRARLRGKATGYIYIYTVRYDKMPAGEDDARHIAASSAKARGSNLYAAGNFAQVGNYESEILFFISDPLFSF